MCCPHNNTEKRALSRLAEWLLRQLSPCASLMDLCWEPQVCLVKPLFNVLTWTSVSPSYPLPFPGYCAEWKKCVVKSIHSARRTGNSWKILLPRLSCNFLKCIESRLQLQCFLLWKYWHYPAERKSVSVVLDFAFVRVKSWQIDRDNSKVALALQISCFDIEMIGGVPSVTLNAGAFMCVWSMM